MEKTISKLDIESILNQFINLYGQSAIWYISYSIAFIFTLYVLYLYVKHKGLLTSPLERTMNHIRTNLERNTETLGKVSNMLDCTLERQESHLRTSQIRIIVDDKIILFKKYFLKEIMEIFEKNNLIKKQSTLRKISDNFTAIIREEDEKFFKLPGVGAHIIPTSGKLRTLELENVYDRIYNIMIDYKDDKQEVKRRCQNLMDNFITNSWRLI